MEKLLKELDQKTLKQLCLLTENMANNLESIYCSLTKSNKKATDTLM